MYAGSLTMKRNPFFPLMKMVVVFQMSAMYTVIDWTARSLLDAVIDQGMNGEELFQTCLSSVGTMVVSGIHCKSKAIE